MGKSVTVTNHFIQKMKLDGIRLLLSNWSSLVWENVEIYPSEIEHVFSVMYKGLYENKPLIIYLDLDGKFTFSYNGKKKGHFELNKEERKLATKFFFTVHQIYNELNYPTI